MVEEEFLTRVLFVDARDEVTPLACAELRHAGMTFQARSAKSLPEVQELLATGEAGAVVAAYGSDSIDPVDILDEVRVRGLDLPLIVVSNTIGEDRAAELIRTGIADVVSVDRLARLPQVIERELREARKRRERQELALALFESQKRYRVTFEQAPVGIVNADRDARIVDVNERFAQMLGYTRDELVGRLVFDVSHPDDVAMAAAYAQAVVSGAEKEAKYRRRYLRKDGSTVWAEVRLTPVRNVAGELEYMLGLVHDVTAQHDAEERIALQALLLDSVEESVIACDVDGRAIFWNRFAEGMFGWSSVEALGRNVHDLIDTATSSAQAASHDRLMNGRSWSGETRLRRRDGSTFPAWMSVAPIIRDGRVVGSVAVSEDVSERERAEARLISSERQLAQAQRIARVGSWSHDLVTGAAFWSAELFRLHQLPVTPPVPSNDAIYSAIHPDDRDMVRESYEAAMRDEAVYRAEYRIVLPDGENRMLRAEARLERDPSGRPLRLVGAAHDITEAKLRERKLELLALQQAAAANLGHYALSGTSTRDLFAHAITFAKYLLDADEAELLRASDDGYLCSSTTNAPVSGTSDGRWALAEFAISSREAVFIADVDQETRFDVEPLRTHGLRAALMVPLAIGFDEPWGTFAVFSHVPRRYTEDDAEFLRSVAPVLGQAIESERARKELVASEQNYRNVIEGASEVIFSVAPSGMIITLNPAFEQVTGEPAGKWIGRSVMEIIAPECRDEAASRMAGLLRNRTPTNSEVTIIGSDRLVLMQVTSFPHVERGEVKAIYGFARDVTAERAADIERRELTRNLQLLLDSTAEGICTIDTDGRCTMVNRSFTQLVGWTAEELIGKRAHDLVHYRQADGTPLDHEQCPILGAIRRGAVEAVQNDVLWRKDGFPIPVQYSAAPIIDNDQIVGGVISFIDVTEKLRLEARLEQATRLAGLGRLAATVAHEFNNVLMGISPFVELLGRNIEPRGRATALEQISRSIRRGKRVTEEILRFAQTPEPSRSPFDATTWIETLVGELQPLLPTTVTVATDVPPHSVIVLADAAQLHQVLLNLVLNSRDAMPNGGWITIALELGRADASYSFGGVEAPERYAHFSVTDSGHGIPATTMQHIFEPLFTTKKTGTGLGLPLAHQIVQAHGGEIFVESQEGVGTAFHLFIPLSTEAVVPEPPPAVVNPGLCARRILLVEDDQAVSSGLTAMLELEGIEVEVAESAAECLASLERSRPDVVVLDLDLPDADGTEVYARIAEKYPHLPVVFSTGHGDPSALEDHLMAPHVDMLRKPYDTATLLRVLEEVCMARPGRKPLS